MGTTPDHAIATARTHLGPVSPEPGGRGTLERLADAVAGLGARRPLVAGASLGLIALLCSILVVARSPEVVSALEAAEAGVGPEAPAPGAAAPGAAGPSASGAAAAPPKRTRATPDELDAADTPEKLSALAETYPEDPAVLKRLAVSQASAGDHSAAIRAVRRLVRHAPAAAKEDGIQQVVLRAANGTPEVMELAMELMSEGMGPEGPDLLYTIATTDKMGKAPRERADKQLATEAVRKLASPALLIAVDLRGTKNACEKKILFGRAKEVGDARSLPYLTPLQATSGCGFLSTGDCFKCLGGRQDLREAIAAIQARERAGKQ